MSETPTQADSLHLWRYDMPSDRYTCVCGAEKSAQGRALNEAATRLCPVRFLEVPGLNVSDNAHE